MFYTYQSYYRYIGLNLSNFSSARFNFVNFLLSESPTILFQWFWNLACCVITHIVCTILIRNSFLSLPFSIRPCCQQATQLSGLIYHLIRKDIKKKNIKFCLNFLSINFLINLFNFCCFFLNILCPQWVVKCHISWFTSLMWTICLLVLTFTDLLWGKLISQKDLFDLQVQKIWSS